MSWHGVAVGKWTLIMVFISITRAAILISRRRRVSNWATRQTERFGIRPRRLHSSQYAPAWEHLGIALRSLGRYQQSLRTLRQALAAGGDRNRLEGLIAEIEEQVE